MRRYQRWAASEVGTIKFNVDAAVQMEETKIFSGILAIDFLGRVLAVQTVLQDAYACSNLAEFFAVLDGFRLGRDFGYNMVILESDFLKVDMS